MHVVDNIYYYYYDTILADTQFWNVVDRIY